MYYNKENVERLRQRYPEGTRICLDRMNDDPFPVESGTLGRVDHVDDIGTLHCIFDNGRTLVHQVYMCRLNQYGMSLFHEPY